MFKPSQMGQRRYQGWTVVVPGNSNSQEEQTQNGHIAVQDQEPSSDVQADVGREAVKPTFIERLLAPRTDHIGKSIKLTQGYKVTLLGPPMGPYSGKEAGYHKHGFTLEQLNWLKTNVGETVGHHLWEEGEGQWLYQGSRWGKSDLLFRGGTLWMDFRFRDRRKAMMFKLIFHGLC